MSDSACAPSRVSQRTVLLASPRSFCAGVQRAIDIVQAAIAASPANEPVYVRKHIVHNNHVVARLEAQGAVFVDELDEVAGVIQALRERFPLIQEPPSEDICYATTNRQNAVRALLPEADLLLVVGSSHSANSALLADLARRAGTAAHLIDSSVDIDPAWLESAATVAVSAVASALPAIVEEVVAAIRALGPVIVTERSVTTETVHFALPRKVRAS
jgi:4-hydroxy-3-methylbut-2-enyl diphosphate reductase IspH